MRATWPTGQFEDIGAFGSEQEARHWIAEQSEVWLGSPLAANRPPRKRPRDEPTPEEHQAAELGRRGGSARAKALSGKKRKAAKAARARPAAARAPPKPLIFQCHASAMTPWLNRGAKKTNEPTIPLIF